MRLTSYCCSTKAVRAVALFMSALQRSGNPSAGQVRQAAAAVRKCGWVLAGNHARSADPLPRQLLETAGKLLVRGSQPQAEAG